MTLFYNPLTFMLLAARLSGLLLALPGVNETNVPRFVRVAIILWITVLLVPLLPDPTLSAMLAVDAVYHVACEFVVGIGQGMIVRVIFSGFQFGGAIVDSELGYTAAQQINPYNPLSGGVFARVFMLAGLFYFWALDYLPLTVEALRGSLDLLPLGTVSNPLGDVQNWVRLVASTIVGAVVLCAPVFALNFCITIALGFLARAVQGINIFYENFTFKLVLGLAGVTLVFLPILLYIIRVQMETIVPEMTRFFQSLAAVNA